MITAAAIGLLFVVLFSSMIYRHNDDIQIMTSAFVDSGSLMNDYLLMAGPPGDMNQNIRYHAGIYGWFYNTVIVVGILAQQAFAALTGSEVTFSDNAVWARTVSLVFTALWLPLLFIVMRRFGVHYLVALLLVVVVAAFPPTVKLAFEIHPEPGGLLMAVLTLLMVRIFMEDVGRNEKYLFAAWAASLCAVMSKQSYLVYPFIPVIAGFVGVLSASGGESKGKCIVRIAGVFVGVAVVAVLLFHPYALLRPLQFLEKQHSIHAFHSTMFKPVGEAAARWFALLSENDLWLLAGLGLALVRIGVNRFRGELTEKLIDIVAVILVLFAVLVVVELRFYFLRPYMYPALPLVCIVWGVMLTRVKVLAFRGLATVFLLATLPAYVMNVVGILSREVLIDRSVQFAVHDRLAAYGKRDWNVIYSTSLAVPISLYPKTANSFQFDPSAPDFPQRLKEWGADLVIIDLSYPHSPPKAFEDAATAAGFVPLARFSGLSAGRLGCELTSGFNWGQCAAQIRELRSGKAPEGVAQAEVLVMGKAELAGQFEKFGETLAEPR